MGDSAAKRKRFSKALRTTEGIRNKELRIKNKRFQSETVYSDVSNLIDVSVATV